MAITTTGGMQPTQVPISPTLTVRVWAPGIPIRWSAVEEVPAFEGAAVGDEDGWAEAIVANELEPAGAVNAEPLEIAAEAAPTISAPGSDDSQVELRAMPAPGDGLLVMVESGGIVQWYVPTNPPGVMAGPLGLTETAPVELRFLVPRSALSRPGIPGVGESIGGAIVRFFRFRLVQELIGASVTTLLSWIIDKVERRAKQEGFRYFDSAAQFPLVPNAELQAMSGQRVLLLTHGIFSSLAGAFAGIADPATPLMQHLRSVYGDRIIGWDHWTVAKTPLENAGELLAALPPDIRPDIVCHSRGALVTRAMLEHPSLAQRRQSRFGSVGKAIFVGGANQGSQLTSFANVNRLLRIYSAIGSIPLLGAAGVVLGVLVGVLRVLAHGASKLPSFEALSPDLEANEFLRELNTDLMTPTGEILVVHANYDPSSGPLAGFLDLNVDVVFGVANDMVVPFTGAEVFDKGQPVGTNLRFGTASQTQPVVMHTNFFRQPAVQELLQLALV